LPVSPPSPLELLELSFMRTALLELGLLAVAGGVLGAFVVLRRLAFYSHAVGTATFPGLVAAEAAGVGAAVGGLAAAIGFAGGVERAGRRGRDFGDAATGLLLVAGLGLGVILASDVFESGAAVDRLLFGTLLGLDTADVALSAAAALAAVAAAVALGRAFTAVAFDPDGTAAIAGRGARTADAALLALIAIATVAALPAVGALLTTSLFVVPAATARLLARSVPGLIALAVSTAVLVGVLGLYLALWLDVPPGPAVASVGAAAYAAVALIGSARR
jgi:ABC-type Mn2+/Zn2+ transport system permease subunit